MWCLCRQVESKGLNPAYFFDDKIWLFVVARYMKFGTKVTDKHTRAVRKVSSHFEYLENRSRGFDVAWHLLRRDLTVHPGTVILP